MGLVFIIVLAIIKYILFLLCFIATMGKLKLWIFPNLTEDVGFFESFWPMYVYTYDRPKKEKDSDDEENGDGARDGDGEGSETKGEDEEEEDGEGEDADKADDASEKSSSDGTEKFEIVN